MPAPARLGDGAARTQRRQDRRDGPRPRRPRVANGDPGRLPRSRRAPPRAGRDHRALRRGGERGAGERAGRRLAGGGRRGREPPTLARRARRRGRARAGDPSLLAHRTRMAARSLSRSDRPTSIGAPSIRAPSGRTDDRPGLRRLALDARTERRAARRGDGAACSPGPALARGLDRLPGGDATPRALAAARLRQDRRARVAPAGAGEGRRGRAGARGLRRARAASPSWPRRARPRRRGARRAPARRAPRPATRSRPSGSRSAAAVPSPSTTTTAAPPWIESRLQDFFGTRAVPAIGGGRVPLTVHLLAPNGRAVQVTRDLAGFWTQHYPALRRELGRRYPKHAWPEDGATARPPAPAPRRR